MQPALRGFSAAGLYKQYDMPYHPGALKYFKEKGLAAAGAPSERGAHRRGRGGVRLRRVAGDCAVDQRPPGAAGRGRRAVGARRAAALRSGLALYTEQLLAVCLGLAGLGFITEPGAVALRWGAPTAVGSSPTSVPHGAGRRADRAAAILAAWLDLSRLGMRRAGSTGPMALARRSADIASLRALTSSASDAGGHRRQRAF